jgi:hypothetical protein
MMAKKNVTFVIEEDLNRNVEIHAAIEGKQKSEILTEALTRYFAEKTAQQKLKELSSNQKSIAYQTATP